jgi:hypothetical protein
MDYLLKDFLDEIGEYWVGFSENMKECLSKLIAGEGRAFVNVDIRKYMENTLALEKDIVTKDMPRDALAGYDLGVKNCLEAIDDLYSLKEEDEVFVIERIDSDSVFDETLIEEIV